MILYFVFFGGERECEGEMKREWLKVNKKAKMLNEI